MQTSNVVLSERIKILCLTTETLAKILDYFDCSVDYLLVRTDNLEINRYFF